MENIIPQPPHLSPLVRTKVLWSLASSLFWAITMWGYWSRGTYAFGLNAFVYLVATSMLFLWAAQRKGIKLRQHAFWLVPLGMIVVSYLLYDIPFLKQWNFFVFLAAFAFFTNYAFMEDAAKHLWSDPVLTRLIIRCFSFVDGVRESAIQHARLFSFTQKEGSKTKRIALGIFLFVAIAVSVVLPLLSSADPDFARQMRFVTDWIQKFISATTVTKGLFAATLSIAVTAAALSWLKPFTAPEAKESKHIDPIVSGIVLGGILVLYLLFIGIQLKRLWVGSLPFDFKDVEHFVKSGFWQLFALTCLNLVIYFATYRKTVPTVQKILTAFSVASLLLLASAAQRMGLYVTFYGFSYEKFFASYTVLYCAVLLVWLICRMFMAKRADIAKFVVVLFLWMYGIATVLPVEQLILRTNMSLAQRPDTQIRIYELTMLSPDVLGLVRSYQSQGKLGERAEKYARENASTGEQMPNPEAGWNDWIERQAQVLHDKHWYEMNLMNLLTR